MTDEQTETAAHSAQLDRLSAKLERLSAQRRALGKAMSQFGGDFDAKAWKQAFDSPDPDDINRVFAVTGGYLALVNNTAEAIRAGAKLTGLKSTAGLPGVPGMIDAIRGTEASPTGRQRPSPSSTALATASSIPLPTYRPTKFKSKFVACFGTYRGLSRATSRGSRGAVSRSNAAL